MRKSISIGFLFTLVLLTTPSCSRLYFGPNSVPKFSTNQPNELGPNVSLWEDGLRTSGDKNEFEWWYFDAKLDDGLIDVIIAEGNISRLRLLNVLPKLFNGTHINEPEVKYIQCKEFNLISEGSDQLNIDGEMIGESPFESKVLEKEIDIFY